MAVLNNLKRVLIANRGEIACRVIKSAQRLGLETVALYSEADARAKHARLADIAVPVGAGSAAATSYLDVESVLAAAKATGADCVHPGYGFLSENAAFARACEAAGVAFVGPPSSAIEDMGDKLRSKEIAQAAGVSVIPGGGGAVESVEEALAIAADIGYPVMLKASAGGGGKGMRVAHTEEDVRELYAIARDEAARSFGDDRLLVEKFVTAPRHVEIQLVADGKGHVACFPERECSVQRRNQKVLEEAPSPFLFERPELRDAMQEQAAMLARAVGYASAGTVEMLVDGETGAFYFLEMNTRLQVEHPVTEAVAGEDLVELMLRVADGQALPEPIRGTPEKHFAVPFKGWAVEARVYAEDAERGFVPSTGVLTQYVEPAGCASFLFEGDEAVRVDSAVEDGAAVSIHYDPMIAKLVGRGPDRAAALAATAAALDAYVVEGLVHNVPFCRAVCGHPVFASGVYSTAFLEEHYGGEHAFREADVLAALADGEPAAAAELAAVVVGVDAAARAARGEAPLGDGPQIVVLAPPRAPDAAREFEVAAVDGGAYAVTRLGGGETIETSVAGAAWAAPLAAPIIDVGGATVQYVQGPPAPGFDHALRVRGCRVDAVVRTPAEHALCAHALPPPPPESLAGLRCPMPGTVLSFACAPGDVVEEGQPLAVVEAMKMQNVLRAEHKVVVASCEVEVGDVVAADQMLVKFVVE